MSTLTRTGVLAAAVLSAVRGASKNGRLEEERPEDMEDDLPEEDASEGEDASEDDPSNDGDAEGEAPAEEEATEEDGTSASSSASSIRRAEQSRIRAILTHPAADANPGLAAELAFGSVFHSQKSAVALLNAAGGGSRLASRMQGRSPQLGSGVPGGNATTGRGAVVAHAGSMIKAMHGRKRKGE